MSETTPLIDQLPPRGRRVAYFVGSLVGLVLAATAVGFGAAGAPIPVWLTVGLAVYGFVAAPLFGIAARNTHRV